MKKIKRGNKTYKYYSIVESYRDEKGQPRQKVLIELGSITDNEAEKLKMIVALHKDNDFVLSKTDDIQVLRHWLFLPVIILHSIWRIFNLNQIFRAPMLVEAMVINRCLEPLSKINIIEWMDGTVLPALYKSEALPNEYAVYNELDLLNRNEKQLQSHLYKQLEQFDSSLGEGFFYDITSTYMEGSQCVIAKFGYSRDHRPDRKQIVIALMVTPHGSPFYWKVMPGNTQDVTTLPDVVNDLKKRFGLKEMYLVFDRGMVSSEHLTFLEGNGVTYISAMDKDEINILECFDEFLPCPVSNDDYSKILKDNGFESIDEQEILFACEQVTTNRRHIIVFDTNRFLSDQKSREKRMSKITEWINDKNISLSAAQKSRNLKPLERDIDAMLSKRKFKGIVLVNITPIELMKTRKNGTTKIIHSFSLSYTINEEKSEKSKRLDGITCFITNDFIIPLTQVVQKYRDKNKIEEAFGEMKSQLALRPIFLTRTERVKAHVSICILAYLLLNTMEIILSRADYHISPAELLRRSAFCQLSQVAFKDSTNYSIVVTDFTSQMKQWISLFNCNDLVSSNSIKCFSDSIKKMYSDKS